MQSGIGTTIKTAAIALFAVGICAAQKPDVPPASSQSTPPASPAAQSSQQPSKDAATTTARMRTYKGTLVDAACAGVKSPGTESTADRSAKPGSTSGGSPASKSGDANRSTDSGSSCTVSTSTTAFALKTRDGNVLAFDDVGNERAKEELTAKKKWADAAAAGKPIMATVNSPESSSVLTVLSLN